MQLNALALMATGCRVVLCVLLHSIPLAKRGQICVFYARFIFT